MSVHDGHRNRVKERFLKEGVLRMQEHEVLEFLLFYCIPRRDTNVIAHNLINRFGSLAKALDAPLRELKKVDGIGDNAAVFLQLVKAICGYYSISKGKEARALSSIEACAAYIKPYLHGLKDETVMMLCLDAKCMVIDCLKVGEGSVNTAAVPIRKIVDMAIATNAVSVVLAHNHPGGLALPSLEDVATTKEIARALRYVDVVLSDHIIVADGECVSLAASSIYNPDNLDDR